MTKLTSDNGQANNEVSNLIEACLKLKWLNNRGIRRLKLGRGSWQSILRGIRCLLDLSSKCQASVAKVLAIAFLRSNLLATGTPLEQGMTL